MKRKTWLKGSSVAAVAIAMAVPSLTPFSVANAQEGAETGDTIVVTGSRIRRKSQFDLPSPVETVGSEDIADVGAKNIADITQTLTINTGAENNPDAFTQNSTTGTSNINLRGLGVQSTLVLLNGKRQVVTATTNNSGIQFVDTSSLVPLIAIDRVEILKDGASAIYGSDAVAGVANFITYDDFDGVKLNAQYQSVTGTGSADEYIAQGLWGKTWDGGNALFAFSYTDRGPLTTAEKRLSRPEDDSSALGNPGAYFIVDGPLAAPLAGLPIIDPTGCGEFGGIPQVLAPNVGGTGLDAGFCRFDFGDFFNLIADEERIQIYGEASFDINDTMTFNVEVGGAENEAVRGNSPTFPFLQTAIVPSTHPENPFGATVAFFGRAIGNGGEVSPNTITSDTYRLSMSLEGERDNGDFWDIAFTSAQNDYVVATEDTITSAFQAALLDGSFNPFSTSFTTAPNSQAVLDSIIGTQVRDLSSELLVIEGSYSTSLWETANGPVGFAFGGQFREEDLSADFDAISQADDFGFIIGEQPYRGDVRTVAVFAEASIPLSPIAELQLAGRFEDYGEQTGDTFDPKIALLVQPNDQLSLRGSFSTSFRAPSVFQTQGQGTSLNQAVDPLNGATAFIAVRALGNQDLVPEESEAYNLGFSWEPTDGLTIDVDYYDFEFENVIIPEAFQALLNANPIDTRYDPANPTQLLPGREECIRANTIACRAGSATGALVQVNSNYVNASSVSTSGIDFSVQKEIELGEGMIVPFIEGTYVLEYDLEDPQAGSVDGAGNRNFTNFGTSTPELRLNTGFGWQNGNHSANLFVRHIDSYNDDQNPGQEVDSHTTVDWQYSLDMTDWIGDGDTGVALTVGMINATDEDPPQVFTNGGFDSKVHDPRGQLTYVGLDLEF